MECLSHFLKLMHKDECMASADLKDAFYIARLHHSHQKYFKFEWFRKCHKFAGMSNGYSDAMKKFTQLLKPVFGQSSFCCVSEWVLSTRTQEHGCI